jgi:demethylmenaquinone methyltransferase/2-methoxy-6-polyprenyl-1,4-benzoquinol methylase
LEPSASSRKRHALHLFTGLPGRYGLMGAVLSFGQDPRWRRALVRGVAPSGERVLDVAAGTGLVTAELIRQGAAHVTGVDQSEAMLDGARARVAGDDALRERVELVRGEAERLPFADDAFEVVTFTYLLRYVDDRAATMQELVRVLVPGGRIGMLEFGVPSQPVLRILWRVHTRVGLPLLGCLVSRAWFEVGRFLGPNIERFHAAEQDLAGLWRGVGITDIRVRRMSFGA